MEVNPRGGGGAGSRSHGKSKPTRDASEEASHYAQSHFIDIETEAHSGSFSVLRCATGSLVASRGGFVCVICAFILFYFQEAVEYRDESSRSMSDWVQTGLTTYWPWFTFPSLSGA